MSATTWSLQPLMVFRADFRVVPFDASEHPLVETIATRATSARANFDRMRIRPVFPGSRKAHIRPENEFAGATVPRAYICEMSDRQRYLQTKSYPIGSVKTGEASEFTALDPVPQTAT
jgi:hypothetical protein